MKFYGSTKIISTSKYISDNIEQLNHILWAHHKLTLCASRHALASGSLNWLLPFLEGSFSVILIAPSLTSFKFHSNVPTSYLKLHPFFFAPNSWSLCPVLFFSNCTSHLGVSKILSVFCLLSVSMRIFLCSGKGLHLLPSGCIPSPEHWVQHTVSSKHSVDHVKSQQPEESGTFLSPFYKRC